MKSKTFAASLRETQFTIINFLKTRWSILLYFLVALIFLGNFIKPDYATDTYADVMFSASELISNFLRGGRLITLIFFIIFRGLHIPVQLVNVLSFCLAIIALVAALYLLETILRRNLVKHKFWPVVLSFLIIFNPFIIELFLFVEKGIMITAILACVLAAYYFNQYLDHKSRFDLLKTFLFVIFATFCYQGIVGLFIVLVTLLVVLRSKTWLDFFKHTTLSVLIYALGPIINIIFIKIFSSGGRTGGEIILSESLTKILTGAKDMFNLFNILPGCIYWGVIAVAIISWLLYCLRKNQLFQKLTLITFAEIFYLLLVICLAALAPQAIQNTAAIWIIPRSVYIFASFIGVVFTIILHNYPKLTAKLWWNNINHLAALIFVAFEFVGFNRIILSHYNINTIDRLRAERIGQLIRDYEAKYNTVVTSIAPANDASLTYSYNGLFVHGDINVSAFSTDWSDVTSLGFWNGRSFVRQTADPEWSKYCADHDWQSFDASQIQFSGDTLQICWY